MLNDRFWNKVDRAAPNGCWEWTANKNNKGYGMFSVSSFVGKQLAHRLSYESAHGRIPAGLHILHSCDNPACVNPAHLRPGTMKENVADMDARQRRVSPHLKGETNPWAKLTDAQVIALRRDYIAGMGIEDICERYSVTLNNLHDLTGGRRWTHLFGDGKPTLAELKNECARRMRSNCRLDENTVRTIRQRLTNGEQGKALAAEYGIHKATISDIKLRKIWADI